MQVVMHRPLPRLFGGSHYLQLFYVLCLILDIKNTIRKKVDTNEKESINK